MLQAEPAQNQYQQIQFYQFRLLGFGDQLFIVGNISELGSWNPHGAIKMTYADYHQWKVEIQLPMNTRIEYKYLIINEKNEIDWERGENRQLYLSNAQTSSIRLMTFNIRYENNQDGPNSWDNRKSLVSKLLNQKLCDFVGLQEVLENQINYLNSTLPNFNSIGRGRGIDFWSDEGSPILYNMQHWDVLHSEVKWLSNSDDIAGSRSYGNNIPRIFTFVKLQSKENNTLCVCVYNTHLDHESSVSQVSSIKQIKSHMMQREQLDKNDIIILMGDFNCLPTSQVISLAQNEGTVKLTRSFSITDAALATFHNFYGFKVGLHIDYIFYRKAKQSNYQIVREQMNGKFPSDHFPVYLELNLI